MDKNYFENFQPGFYSYKGELAHISRKPNKELILKSPGDPITIEGKILGGLIIYSIPRGPKEDVEFDLLKPVDPLNLLKEKTSRWMDFIKSIENHEVK